MAEVISPDESSIRLAGPDDLKILLDIMGQANEYAATKAGEPLWTNIPLARDSLSTLISQGNCFVSINEQGKIVSSVSLVEEDTYMWGEEGLDGTALYFHKLMKNPASSQPRPGLLFLAFAAREAIRRRKIHLRCDTKPSMVQLMNYYQKLGFTQQRTVPYPSTGLMATLLEADPTEVLDKIARLS